MRFGIFWARSQLLTAAGYQQYETSAYAKQVFSVNIIWIIGGFRDYLAIGCGAPRNWRFRWREITRFQNQTRKVICVANIFTKKKRAEIDRPFGFYESLSFVKAVPKQGWRLQACRKVRWKIKLICHSTKLYCGKRWFLAITEHVQLFLNELLELF